MEPAPRLYALLGVQKNASERDIKRAYHEKALHYHPDKNPGPEAAAQMSQINEAYEVLKDPSKRSTYDRFGERGLQQLNGNPGVASVAEVLGVSALFFGVAILLFTIMFCMIAQMGMLSTQIDSKKEDEKWKWSWGATLWPLWVWDTFVMIICIGVIIALIASKIRDGAESSVGFQSFLPFISIISMFVWTALLGSKLDNKHTMTWPVVFIPFWVGQAIEFLRHIPALRPSFIRSVYVRSGIPEPPAWLIYLSLIMAIVSQLVGMVCGGLLVAKLHDGLTLGWTAVFLPYYIYLGIYILQHWATVWVITGIQAEHGAIEGNLCVVRVCGMLQSLILQCLPFTTVLLINLKLEGSDRPLSVCFIPMFILCSIGLLMSCLLLCLSCCHLAQGVSQAEDAGYSRMDDDDHHHHASEEQTFIPKQSPPPPPPPPPTNPIPSATQNDID